jgi:hypothetical protein
LFQFWAHLHKSCVGDWVGVTGRRRYRTEMEHNVPLNFNDVQHGFVLMKCLQC